MTTPSASIAQLVMSAAEINRLVAAADVNSIWQYGQPNEGADGERIARLWRSYSQFPELVEFLGVADGWGGFYHDVDLLSSDDLEGGTRLDRAWLLAESADQGSGGVLALDRSNYLPIGVAMQDVDVFLLSARGGTVRWISGEEIEVFPSIDSFLGGMTEYNQETLQDLRADPWLGAG
jgi:hypothetical protein